MNTLRDESSQPVPEAACDLSHRCSLRDNLDTRLIRRAQTTLTDQLWHSEFAVIDVGGLRGFERMYQRSAGASEFQTRP